MKDSKLLDNLVKFFKGEYFKLKMKFVKDDINSDDNLNLSSDDVIAPTYLTAKMVNNEVPDFCRFLFKWSKI
jgi:hypothetical protein